MRRFEESEKLLREAAGKKDSRQNECLTELGYVFYKAGEWTKAIAAANELDGGRSSKPAASDPAQRGAAKLGMGDYEGGMADIDESLKRFPCSLVGAPQTRTRAGSDKDLERAIGSLERVDHAVAGRRRDSLRSRARVRKNAHCSAASIHLKKAAETGDLSEAELTNVGAILVSMEGVTTRARVSSRRSSARSRTTLRFAVRT